MGSFVGALRRPGVLLCVFACLLASFAFANGALAHEEGAAGEVVVHVTEKGFEPESVKVRAGETVVFENVDDEGHWPASDSHPTHEEHPAFDPKKPVQPSTEWSFTFDEPGSTSTTTT